MFLAIDIGNTNITLGVFNEISVEKIFRLDTKKDFNAALYKNFIVEETHEYKIKACAIISVSSGLENKIKKVCDELFCLDSVIIDYKCITDMEISVKNPEKVGIDRLVNAYAAKMFKNRPIISIDAGTAITVDVVSERGDFIGGVIIPGINLQLLSLHENTSKLPLIELKDLDSVIGDNTENAILSGVINGISGGLDSIINKIQKELSQKPVIVVTGGQGNFLLSYMSTQIDYFIPNLTLIGIKKIYDSMQSNI